MLTSVLTGAGLVETAKPFYLSSFQCLLALLTCPYQT